MIIYSKGPKKIMLAEFEINVYPRQAEIALSKNIFGPHLPVG